MKKLVILPFLLIVFISLAGYWFYQNSKPVAPGLTSFENFTVKPGANATQIGSNLQSKGLIRNYTAYKIYVQFTGISGKIQAGDYRLSPSFTLFQVVDALSKAPLEVKVTIPEGLRREEVAAKFAKSLDQGDSFIAQFLDETKDSEGYLFPDTYLFGNTATPGGIVEKMKANYKTRVNSLTPAESNLTKNDLIILASLVERETKTGDERPIVAGILLNRLEAGWPLQIDATVQYAVATSKCKMNPGTCSWWSPIGSNDLDINSPFNTYKNPGLPPGPISSPGLSAIKAVYNPTKTDYFFYLHGNDGKIRYAKTLEEQNANIDAYLR